VPKEKEGLVKQAALTTFLALTVFIAWTDSGGRVAQEMATEAEHFLAELGPEQQERASFFFNDAERFNWHYIPRKREGISFREMTPAQRKLATGLLASGLSRAGILKAMNIMVLDQVLYEIQNQNRTRDPDAYYFTVFSQPSATEDWGWRVEGHHLSLNYAIHQGRVVSSTPSFWGADPAEVRSGRHRGLRPLAHEEDWARRLLHSFEGDRRKKVVINVEAPRDIITGTSRKAEPGTPRGIGVAEMNPEQVNALMELIQEYAHRLRPELAEMELDELRKAGIEKIHFAWAGGTESGQPHYYRIQGPTFLIEYDNTQRNANHIHTVWRDLQNDFGEDTLAEHYAESTHHALGY
jgi:hypothetical protein